MNTVLLELLAERRSIRRYRDDAVPAETIEQVLTAAIWSPSAHNRQPFRFCVITSLAIKDKLARAMGEQLRSDLARDGLSEAAIDADCERSYARIVNAPALILLCLSMAEMDVYRDEARAQNEYTMAVQSTAMAGQNLLLAAHALGLGACWMCAPLFCPHVVSAVMALPEDWQPQALITLGFPAESRTKTRKPLSESVLWR